MSNLKTEPGQMPFSQEFADLFDESLICHLSHDGQILDMNEKWTDVLGWQAIELLPGKGSAGNCRRLDDLVHAEDWSDLQKAFQFSGAQKNLRQQAQQGLEDTTEVVSFNARMLNKDGNYLTFNWRVKWVETKALYLCCLIDVTTLNDQLTANYARLRSVFEQAPCGFFLVGLDGRCSYVNRYWEQISGLSLAESVGLGWVAAMHPEELPKVSDYFQRFLSGEIKDYFLRHRVVNVKTKVESFVIGRVIPVAGDSGLVEEYIGVIQDESERVTQENEIQAQREKLISSSKLSSLGEMAGGIAHEINNPLAVIQGKVAQIQSMSESGRLTKENLKKELDKIGLTSQRIAKIVKGLRTFARDGATDPFNLVSLRLVVEESMGLCLERFRNHGVELGFDFELADGQSDKVECRAVQLGQVLVNLLNNAFDAVVGQNNSWVKLQVQYSDAAVRILIQDSGPGIPDAIRQKMMQPFFTTKEIGKGTGLGLSISRGILEAHGGKLWLDEACANTCFVCELPRVQDKRTKSKSAA